MDDATKEALLWGCFIFSGIQALGVILAFFGITWTSIWGNSVKSTAKSHQLPPLLVTGCVSSATAGFCLLLYGKHHPIWTAGIIAIAAALIVIVWAKREPLNEAPTPTAAGNWKPKWQRLQSAYAEIEKLKGEVQKWKEMYAAENTEKTNFQKEMAREKNRADEFEVKLAQASEIESTNHVIGKLIARDAANLRSMIRQYNQRIEFHFTPSSDPYLEIITELWNGSVFELVSFGEITGHVTYAGRQLAGEPRVVVSVEPPVLNLYHGDSVILVVRQYLSSQVADAMVAARDRGIAIDFGSVFVSFKVLPLDGITKKDIYMWQGPRFAIEDAKRV